MTETLQLLSWLTADEAIRYSKIYGYNTSFEDLFRAYCANGFELKIDHKDPMIFYVHDDLELVEYPDEIHAERIEDYFYVGDPYSLVHLGEPERLLRETRLVSPGRDEIVFARRSFDGLRFNACCDCVSALYVRENENAKTSSKKFKIIKWGDLLANLPHLLLFDRSQLDELYASSSELDINGSADEIDVRGSDKVLKNKEKNTLLVLIAALCRELGIDPNKRGVTSSIQLMTEQLGAPISDDTIRSILKQIDSAVESRLR
jgi:hypothetical protein